MPLATRHCSSSVFYDGVGWVTELHHQWLRSMTATLCPCQASLLGRSGFQAEELWHFATKAHMRQTCFALEWHCLNKTLACLAKRPTSPHLNPNMEQTHPWQVSGFPRSFASLSFIHSLLNQGDVLWHNTMPVVWGKPAPPPSPKRHINPRGRRDQWHRLTFEAVWGGFKAVYIRMSVYARMQISSVWIWGPEPPGSLCVRHIDVDSTVTGALE